MNDPQRSPDTSTAPISSRRVELERLSKEQLIQLVLELEGEESDASSARPIPRPPARRSFDMAWEPHTYCVMQARSDSDALRWRVVLVSFDLTHPVIGLEVGKEVLVGRSTGTGDFVPDLDLRPLDGLAYGVSRKHALLRPSESGLHVVDLDSTNRTSVNGEAVTPLEPYAVEDQDVLVFGQLQLHARLERLTG